MIGNRPDVLLVEDDAAIREALAEVLDEEGYQVQTAVHGAAALGHLSAGLVPQVILLDLMMPVMDGWQLMRHLQAMPCWAPIPVIILSAATEPVPPGAHAAIGKPLNLDALLDTLTACVHPAGDASAAEATAGPAKWQQMGPIDARSPSSGLPSGRNV